MSLETTSLRRLSAEKKSRSEQLRQLNIAQIHTLTEQADGVSLQVQETRAELKRLGANVCVISADFNPEQTDFFGTCIPELDYHQPSVARFRQEINPELNRLTKNEHSVLTPEREKKLLKEIYQQAFLLEQKLEAALNKNQINVAHVRNITSLPHLHPAAALAIYRLIKRRSGIHFVLHHHDLSWEGPAARFNYFAYPQIEELMQQIQTPDFPNTSHIAINPDTRDSLREKKGVKAEYVPDGFAFDQEVEPVSREKLIAVINQGLTSNEPVIQSDDLLLGMMTRIVSNKAIELAIQLTEHLQKNRSWLQRQEIGPHAIEFSEDSQIILVLPNQADAQQEYKQRLIKHAEQRNVRLVFVENLADHEINFYQTYDAMDAIVYPSEHEGFGNQGIEAVWAMRHLAVHYYSVFKALIDHIPHHTSLGTNEDMIKGPLSDELYLLDRGVLDQAAVGLIKALQDSDSPKKLLENRRLLEKLCSIKRVVQRYIDIYLEPQKAKNSGKYEKRGSNNDPIGSTARRQHQFPHPW